MVNSLLYLSCLSENLATQHRLQHLKDGPFSLERSFIALGKPLDYDLFAGEDFGREPKLARPAGGR